MTADAMSRRLVVEKYISASPERVFAAWTDPEQLLRWWGPAHVECIHAEVDLRIGGTFRIANLLPDGSTVWISGTYELIDPPNRLIHTWTVAGMRSEQSERVQVDFTPLDAGTTVTVVHTNLDDPETTLSVRDGWAGCLAGLAELLTG